MSCLPMSARSSQTMKVTNSAPEKHTCDENFLGGTGETLGERLKGLCRDCGKAAREAWLDCI
jgi:hypothetical protein